MGAGRKTQRVPVNAVPISGPQKANCSVSARNLRKGDLAGVIFGCKHYTINECLTQKIFGLPAQHFPYVRNIFPSMPIFLFNYSDRRLHGIFEAASYGRKNINPHGWTANGNEETEYPAQVRINIRIRCQALVESEFKPIIAENYYTDKHFWFELDRVQTSELISLFEASSASVHSAIPIKVCTGESSFKASSPSAHSAIQKKGFTWCDIVKSLPNLEKRNENDYFESTCNPDKTDEYDDPWPTVPEPYMGFWDQPKMEAHPDREAVDEEEEPLVSPETGEVLTNSSNLLLTTDQEMKVVIAGPMISGMPSEEQCFQEEPLDSEESRVTLVNSANHWSDPAQSIKASPSITSGVPSVQKCFQEVLLVSANKNEISVFPSGCQSVIAQLMLEVQKLQNTSLEQQNKMSALEKNLSESQVQIQQLNIRIKKLESVSDATIKHTNKSDWAPW